MPPRCHAEVNEIVSLCVLERCVKEDMYGFDISDMINVDSGFDVI